MALLLTPEGYKPFINETFSSRSLDGDPLEFTLLEVIPRIDDEVQLSFSLYFRCPAVRQPQHIYSLSHPRLGEFDLFLVPIRQKKDGIYYEAVFNLLRDEE